MSGVMLVAGESSGDVLGARLAAELKNHRPELRLWGIGGEGYAQSRRGMLCRFIRFIGNGLLGRAFAHAGDIGVTSSLAG